MRTKGETTSEPGDRPAKKSQLGWKTEESETAKQIKCTFKWQNQVRHRKAECSTAGRQCSVADVEKDEYCHC